MFLIPDVHENIQDDQIGILPVGADNVVLKIGPSTAGPPNILTSVSDPSQLVVFGDGPLVESAAYHLAASGATTLLIRANTSVPGRKSDVSSVKTGTGELTTAGQPGDSYDVIVSITRDGSAVVGVGQGAFTYSLDGGDSYSAEIAIPSSGAYVLGTTGLTLNFAGNFKAGDRFTFGTTAPAMTLADVMDALNVALNDPSDFRLVHVLGAGSPALFAAVETVMTDAKQRLHRFARAVIEARDFDSTLDAIPDPQPTTQTALALTQDIVWSSNLRAEYGNVSGLRTGVAAGYAELVSPRSGSILRRSVAWPILARLAATAPSVHPGFGGLGALPGVASISHNEQLNQTLDQSGFMTLRTLIGLKGFYVTRGRMMTAPTSDFSTIENGRVMDKACTLTRALMLPRLNDRFRVDPKTGQISEADAAALEKYVSASLYAAMVGDGDASDAFVVLDRTSNILQTKSLRARVAVTPLGYGENIFLDIGFFNPALSVYAQ